MKRLLLVGGGHSNLEVLRRFGAERPAGLEVVLLTAQRQAIYSGMIPGVVAGDYQPEDCSIDLAALASYAGARMMVDAATGIDGNGRRLLTASGAALEYDLISLNVGSSPATHGVPGVAEHALNVKPLHVFLQTLAGWDAGTGARRRIAVVGAGAAGTEITFTLWHRLNGDGAARAHLTLVSEGASLLPGFDAGTRRHAVRIAGARQIELRLGARVIAVDASGIALEGSGRVDADGVIWAAGAAPLPWLRTTPLARDAAGFVSIDHQLQSMSHPGIFAAGDCATCIGDPRPKSGVFAVRQGPVLAENLMRAARGEPLLSFKSSSSALALLNCGGRHALASWHGQAFAGSWVWSWKDWLDRRFVRRYRGLPQYKS